MYNCSLNHYYILHWFEYINKSDFSDSEKKSFFCDLKKQFFRNHKIALPKKRIFGEQIKRFSMEPRKCDFTKTEKSPFHDALKKRICVSANSLTY